MTPPEGSSRTALPNGYAQRTLAAFDCQAFERARLHAGASWGAHVVYTPSCTSTNEVALEAARSGEHHGCLFVTDFQQAGRGQHGRAWLAEPKHSLLFSVLLRPSAGLVLDATLTLAVGLAVRAAVAPILNQRHRVQVKWPNDVWIDGKKVCGILCEALAQGGTLQAVVVGVGLNVAARSFPPEIESSATSLWLNGPQLPNRESLLAQILSESERRLTPKGGADLIQELNAHDALRDRRVSVATAAQPGERTGVARGIDSKGRLLLETESGLYPLLAGTVTPLLNDD